MIFRARRYDFLPIYLRFFQIFFGRPEKNGKQPENSYLCTDGNTVRQYPHPPSDRTRHRAPRPPASTRGMQTKSDHATALEHARPADVQAIGEIGARLCPRRRAPGSNWPPSDAQLATGRGDRQLPVVLHCVRAFEPVDAGTGQPASPRAVIFHGFIGSPEQARTRTSEKGYYLSFGVRTSLRSPQAPCEALRETPRRGSSSSKPTTATPRRSRRSTRTAAAVAEAPPLEAG